MNNLIVNIHYDISNPSTGGFMQPISLNGSGVYEMARLHYPLHQTDELNYLMEDFVHSLCPIQKHIAMEKIIHIPIRRAQLCRKS